MTTRAGNARIAGVAAPGFEISPVWGYPARVVRVYRTEHKSSCYQQLVAYSLIARRLAGQETCEYLHLTERLCRWFRIPRDSVKLIPDRHGGWLIGLNLQFLSRTLDGTLTLSVTVN